MNDEYELLYGYINVKYYINSVTATYENDQDGVEGVSRLTSLEIDVDGSIPDYLKNQIEKDAYNSLCTTEYFDETPHWQNDARSEIAEKLNVSPDIIDIL